ncbi:MAG: hypothetical protein L6Q69_15490 [Zoogloea sp.]|nr:hypothetical protein [Zoogloea sp.]
MSAPRSPAPSRRLLFALALSIVAHGLVLLIQLQAPESPQQPALQARLAPLAAAPQADVRPPAPPPAPTARPKTRSTAKARTAAPRPRILTARKSSGPALDAAESTPRWTVAQKEEMDSFLNELATEAKARPAPPKPDLAERALATAREIAREGAREGRHHREDLADLIERIPNSPPVDPFSLEFYLDSLVKKLNRSAAFVKNDPRARGIQPASVEVRLNPDGSLKSFIVMRSGDQQEEIAFVKSVVNQAAPFAAFPPDIAKSARTLALMICIQPPSLGGGGFGFTRKSGNGC